MKRCILFIMWLPLPHLHVPKGTFPQCEKHSEARELFEGLKQASKKSNCCNMCTAQDLLKEKSNIGLFLPLYPNDHIKFIKKLSSSKIVEFTFEIQKAFTSNYGHFSSNIRLWLSKCKHDTNMNS